MMTRRLALCASLLALALPAQALAAANHPFLSAINGGYEDACGIAFGPGGLYVSDYYHDQIAGPSTIAAESPGDGPCKLAFDAEGHLYVNNWHRDVVKYTEPFASGGGETIDSAQPTGLAVDEATGALYVAHRAYISVYEAPVHAGEAPAQTIGLDPSAEYFGLAVSEFPATAGDIYAPDAKDNTVKVFGPAGALIGEMSGAATPQGRFTYLTDSEAAVDNSPSSPSYGHVFVLDETGHGKSEQPEAVLDEFNAEGAYRGQIAGFTDAGPSGIAFQEGTHNVYVTSGDSEGSAVFVYGPTTPAHSLKVSKEGTGGGAVTSSPPGISCGEACAAEFNEGEKVELFAAPDAHSVFAGWSVSGAEPCPGAGSCTVLMSHGVEVSASFEEPAQETLTVSETGSGSGAVTSEPAGISCPGRCSEHFNQGRLVTLSAAPSVGSELAGWSGACSGTPASEPCEVTMSEAKAVEAEFALAPSPAAASASSSARTAAPGAPAAGGAQAAARAGQPQRKPLAKRKRRYHHKHRRRR
jgi:DNA-binding beta-propeller fold protein YncE